ncbi:hypothetical protein BKA81DRAFT_60464 [Phyllosticta paracitricarpa]
MRSSLSLLSVFGTHARMLDPAARRVRVHTHVCMHVYMYLPLRTRDAPPPVCLRKEDPDDCVLPVSAAKRMATQHVPSFHFISLSSNPASQPGFPPALKLATEQVLDNPFISQSLLQVNSTNMLLRSRT